MKSDRDGQRVGGHDGVSVGGRERERGKERGRERERERMCVCVRYLVRCYQGHQWSNANAFGIRIQKFCENARRTSLASAQILCNNNKKQIIARREGV